MWYNPLNWTVTMAPEPEDVYWDNLKIRMFELSPSVFLFSPVSIPSVYPLSLTHFFLVLSLSLFLPPPSLSPRSPSLSLTHTRREPKVHS